MGKMGKMRGGINRNGSPSPPSGNGGILGSGIFGMFGTIIQCQSTDDSLYCNIMKFFNLFFMILLVIFVLWVIYSVSYPLLFSKRGR
jgi:membrane associated rhomboid family serine protease